MKKLAFVIATAAAVLTAAPLVVSTPAAAQRVDVEVGPRTGVYVGSGHRPHCRMVTVTTWRHGAKVTRTERRCGRDRDRD